MPTGTVLQTKFQRPPPRARLVPRSGLVARLDAGLTGKLTLVSAPAGFGKTTLVSSWLAAGDRPGCWLSLDGGDNELPRFLTYLVMALQRVAPEVGQNVMAVLQSPRTASFEAVLTEVLNDVARLDGPLVLVLDDYHLIHTPEIHGALAFVLEHQPRQLHLVVITREDPMLPLSRLRVRAEITEIYAEDLRFSNEEATAFLNEIMVLGLNPEGVQALEARTEGWIAGLQLAALALQHEADRSRFIEAFAGDDRFITDYLISEVLDHQPPAIRDFLLRTSILDRLTAPLCDALTGRQDSRAVLARIEQANLFLVALDHRRAFYRYHHLFSEMLRHHLPVYLDDQAIAALHRRAADWYRQHGFEDDAVHHLLRAGASAEAADLIASLGLQLLAQGQLRRLLAWISELPEGVMRNRPLLSAQCAWALSLMGRLEEMDAHLELAERALPTENAAVNERILAIIATVRAGVARKQRRSAEAIRQLRTALAYLSADDLLLRCSASFNLGSTYLDMGELALADEALRAALEDGEASGNMYGVLAALSFQADGYALQGRLAEAAERYRRAIALGMDLNNGQPHPLAGFAYAGLGRIQYEQNDANRAEENLRQAIALGERLGDTTMVRRGLGSLCRLKHGLGEREAARALLEQALRLARTYRDEAGEAVLEAYRAQLAVMQAASPRDVADWPAVERWAESYLQEKPDPESFQEESRQLTLARVEALQGRTDQAARRLALLERLAEAEQRSHRRIRILIVRALLEAAGNDVEEASLATLGRALELGAGSGHVRSFVDHGPPMRRLLERALARRLSPSCVATLLAAFEDRGTTEAKKPRRAPSRHQAPPVEPLGERERQILRLMAGFRSNKEIARELGLSVNTVKWYSSILYDKLGVHKRAEAVARARDLDLL